jgi:hypothetical protein
MQMSGYTKLFSSILASTIWQESKETKIIWITMLAASNKDGLVEASVPGLAHMAKLTIPETEDALRVLESPDPYSRTPAFEGRRIQKSKGGWQILNHDKYREQMSAAERKEYNRIKQQESRARRVARGDDVNDEPSNVNDIPPSSMTVNDMSACQRHTDTDTDTKADTEAKASPSAPTGRAKPPVHGMQWTHQDGWTGITDTDRSGWAKAFPACDIDRQLAAASVWLTANPAKAKKQYYRFFTNWLSRAQERGGDVATVSTGRHAGGVDTHGPQQDHWF